MNITTSLALIALAITYAGAIAMGLWIHRVHLRRADVADPDEPLGGDGLGGAVGYIGSAAAFLLGVLMLASLDHYNATKTIVANEALAYSASFESTDGLPAADQTAIQHDLICLMRSVATHSWAAAASEDLTGSDNTHAWRRRASAHAKAVDPTNKSEEDSLASLESGLIAASTSGQERLLAAEEDLPVALWILLLLSVFALVSILTALLRAHASRTLAITALGAVLILTTAMVWTLTMFDRPFYQRDGVYISPRDLNAVMLRLEKTYPGPAWGPCELLADP